MADIFPHSGERNPDLIRFSYLFYQAQGADKLSQLLIGQRRALLLVDWLTRLVRPTSPWAARRRVDCNTKTHTV